MRTLGTGVCASIWLSSASHEEGSAHVDPAAQDLFCHHLVSSGMLHKEWDSSWGPCLPLGWCPHWGLAVDLSVTPTALQGFVWLCLWGTFPNPWMVFLDRASPEWCREHVVLQMPFVQQGRCFPEITARAGPLGAMECPGRGGDTQDVPHPAGSAR